MGAARLDQKRLRVGSAAQQHCAEIGFVRLDCYCKGDIGVPTVKAGGTPGVRSILSRFVSLVSIKFLCLQHTLYWGAVMGTEVT